MWSSVGVNLGGKSGICYTCDKQIVIEFCRGAESVTVKIVRNLHIKL
jgi:hypothetical protein